MQLKLSSNLSLPVDAVTQKFAFLGRTGSGKTYAAMKLAEEMLAATAQIIALDPVGIWYGLRLASDGKSAGISIPVLGGLHGDLPLEPGAGQLIADLVTEKALSVVLDVSLFRKKDRKRFVTDFAEQFFYLKKQSRSAVHIFLEESQVFVPQKTFRGEERMLGAFEDLCKLGRNFGIGASLISQRPQSINKDVLNQTECLVVGQMTGPQERKTILGWIVEKGAEKELCEQLPSLAVGTMALWSPQWLRKFIRVKIGRRKTFDASATPKVGRKSAPPRKLKKMELHALRETMKDVVERAEANDPRALQARIVALEAELRKASKGQRVQTKVVEKLIVKEADAAKITRAAGVAHDVGERMEKVGEQLRTIACSLEERLLQIGPKRQKELDEIDRLAGPPPIPPLLPDRKKEAEFAKKNIDYKARVHGRIVGVTAPDNGSERLAKGAREMLRALAINHPKPLTLIEVATLAGIPRGKSTFRNYRSLLKVRGLVDENGGRMSITDTGRALVGPVGQVQSTADILAMWKAKLKPATISDMLERLHEIYPKWTTRTELAEQVGLSRGVSTFRNYFSKLRANSLLEVNGEDVRASAALFTTR